MITRKKGTPNLILLGSVAILLNSCDKLPFSEDAESSKSTKEQTQKAAVPPKPHDPARDGYILYKSAQPLPPGTVLLTTRTQSDHSSVTFRSGDRKTIKRGETTKDTTKVHGTVIDTEKQITLHVKKHQIAETSKNSETGKSSPKNSHGALHGKVILISQENGVWGAKLKSGEGTKEQLKKLAALAKSYQEPDGRVLYGTNPRKVGDRWRASVHDLPSFRKDGYHVQPESIVKVFFKAVESHQGHQYALLETSIDVYILMTDPSVTSTARAGSVKGSIKFKGKAITYLSLIHRLPLSELTDLQVTAKRLIPDATGIGVIETNGTMVSSQTTELELLSSEKSSN